ncbi:MAG: hypothetical protein D6689_14600 [Deltaproteobacteria bacterium]|nr:MAG: hypothetical protein D6689_14600 [Deltaproteobacteria bacterium]
MRPGAATARAPALTGAFAGGRYDLVGLATPRLGAPAPYTSSLVRDVDLAASAALPPWLAPPAALSAAGNRYAFAPSAGAALHVVAVVDAAGDPVWTALVLDGAREVEPPAEVPLPATPALVRVTGVDWPGFAPAAFRLDDLTVDLARVAGAELRL